MQCDQAEEEHADARGQGVGEGEQNIVEAEDDTSTRIFLKQSKINKYVSIEPVRPLHVEHKKIRRFENVKRRILGHACDYLYIAVSACTGRKKGEFTKKTLMRCPVKKCRNRKQVATAKATRAHHNRATEPSSI